MPKPFPRASLVSVPDRGGLDDRPHCTALIGAIAIEWSNADSMLAFVFSSIIEENSAAFNATAFVAGECFDMITTLKPKMKMLNYALKRYGVSGQDRKQFKKFLNDLQDASYNRNKIAHGRWGVSEAFPNDLVFQPHFGAREQQLVYSVDDLLEILEKISDAAEALFRFFQHSIKPKLEAIYITRKLTLNLTPGQDTEDGIQGNAPV